MKLTNENWFSELGKDILSRGSLYPDSEPIKNLNSTNWLHILGRDILDRGTLYPEGEEDVGELFDNNWLIKLRDNIVTRGTLYPEIEIIEASWVSFLNTPGDMSKKGVAPMSSYTFKAIISPPNATYNVLTFSLEDYYDYDLQDTPYKAEEVASITPDGVFTSKDIIGASVYVVISNNDPRGAKTTRSGITILEGGYHD